MNKQLNRAEWEVNDFNSETGGDIRNFLHYFYTVADSLGYDSAPLVELIDTRFPEHKEISMMIKVNEGY
jgi:hypothetical protein